MTWQEYLNEVLEKYEAVLFVSERGELAVEVRKPLLTPEERLEAALEIKLAVEMLLEAYDIFDKGFHRQA